MFPASRSLKLPTSTPWSSLLHEQCCFLAASLASFKQGGERFGSFQMRSRCGCPAQDFPRKGILEGDLRGEARSCSCGKQPWNSGGWSCGLGNITRNPRGKNRRKKKECGDDLAGPLHFPPQEWTKSHYVPDVASYRLFTPTFLRTRHGTVWSQSIVSWPWLLVADHPRLGSESWRS